MEVEKRIDHKLCDRVAHADCSVILTYSFDIKAVRRGFVPEPLKINVLRTLFLLNYFSYFCIFRAKESGQKNKKLKNQNDIILLGENYESSLAGVKNPCYLFVYSNILVRSFFRGGRTRVPVIVNC